MKYGILSFKGTVKEFRVFLSGLRKDLAEEVEYNHIFQIEKPGNPQIQTVQ
ncbi:hypothetical protein MOD67_13830 [Bacillus licheniformis]|uniref:hypothetical protein n=1 Tax=Bacillus TaxID=1386 RepID=UPI00227F1A00|nr:MULTISPECIES: hypothetical protein [Bacillus]MCY7861101.1 hypothetical protein [Bacillus haynesii]MCY8015570.1 hypothetical protein [Bacillus haynesii]MCY8291569.1 hypothetical protein [Bacillus haynesii]MCY8549193.1 hypothetical protein [Bacillus haynesii]MCY8745060.1 hypothetical protein [Bacillus licheniformis]